MPSISTLNDLALSLVAMDFGTERLPMNPGPTMTSRALAIIHLAAHDAYAKLGVGLKMSLSAKLPPVPADIPRTIDNGEIAMSGAARHAMLTLYPGFATHIVESIPLPTRAADIPAFAYGEAVAAAWLSERSDDGSAAPQVDSNYRDTPGHHRPDPLTPDKGTLGRAWGKVRPFALGNVERDAPLEPPPALDSQAYADAYDDVYANGSSDIQGRSESSRQHAAIGVFWGYDGANKLGTPPRLYNQVVRQTQEFRYPPAPYSMAKQIRYLAAINMAMADAGIAAWHWKYAYDFWRPVVGIREADKGWGPTGAGDGNTLRQERGNPFWLPLGAPHSNPPQPLVYGPKGANFTPNFPAYPSGHAAFGTACFEVFAKMAGKTPGSVHFRCGSDEFNGATTDNTGVARPKWIQNMTLQDAIEQNKRSRIYIGVHWSFDATGGEVIGKAVARAVGDKFP